MATLGEDGVAAYKAQAHCPCSEGFVPRDAGFRGDVSVKILMNFLLNHKKVNKFLDWSLLQTAQVQAEILDGLALL